MRIWETLVGRKSMMDRIRYGTRYLVPDRRRCVKGERNSKIGEEHEHAMIDGVEIFGFLGDENARKAQFDARTTNAFSIASSL
jgi:hypothetical protein